jgi:hypothetical protein
LRGDALKGAIRDTILRQAALADAEGKPFTYIAIKIAQAVPCTRKSLDAYANFIDDVLADLSAQKRSRNGGVMIEALRTRIRALEDRVKELEGENLRMVTENVELYDAMSLASVPAHLIRRIPPEGVVPFRPKS